VPVVSPFVARIVRGATYWAAAAFVGMLVTLPQLSDAARERIPDSYPLIVFAVAAILAVTGSALGITFPGRPRDRGIRDRLRARFWGSRMGERVARLLTRDAPSTSPAHHVHRPTELAIAQAADVLFDALPAATRDELRDLPGIVRGLERDAEALRLRADELTARMADVGHATTGTLADRRRDVSEELRRARDEAARRRDTAVTALESIRLDLLRLQAGTTDSVSITAVLDAARRLGRDVDSLVDARDAAARRAMLRESQG